MEINMLMFFYAQTNEKLRVQSIPQIQSDF
jgi:hypothetical protein